MQKGQKLLSAPKLQDYYIYQTEIWYNHLNSNRVILQWAPEINNKMSGFIVCTSVHCVLFIQVEIINKDTFYYTLRQCKFVSSDRDDL